MRDKKQILFTNNWDWYEGCQIKFCKYENATEEEIKRGKR